MVINFLSFIFLSFYILYIYYILNYIFSFLLQSFSFRCLEGCTIRAFSRRNSSYMPILRPFLPFRSLLLPLASSSSVKYL